jgi:putative restriction endonuclease
MAITTDTAAAAAPDALPATGRVPPLENGDRLTRAEFERRYDAMPNLKKAELIKGVVYVPSPVSFEKHGGLHFDLIGWLAQYRLATPGVRGGDNTSLRLDIDSMPQPDAFLLILPSYGGQARIDEDDYIAGGPELVAEVAASSVSYDLHDKLDVYRSNGVREYIAWRVLDQAIDWFVLRGDHYEALPLDAEGLFKSEVLPGLWLDPAALVRGDLMSAVQTLQQGLASPEHAAFVARLQQVKE